MSRSPTPWHAGKTHRLNTPGEAYETPITDADGNAIATVHNADDAKVMAVAPELAEALQRAVSYLRTCTLVLPVDEFDLYDAVLAKAAPVTGTSLADDKQADRIADYRDSVNDMLDAQGKIS